MAEMAACRLCEPHLPLGPRPVFRLSATARLLIVGQAPGTRVHESGIPWDDRSGQRLREWLEMDAETFYDRTRIAILPTGMCYPGTDPKGGDLPPRPECHPAWHGRVRAHLPAVRMTLLVGSYAQAAYLKSERKPTLTETVRTFGDYMPDYLPLPHPSWRTGQWEKKNPWFKDQVIPALRAAVATCLAE